MYNSVGIFGTGVFVGLFCTFRSGFTGYWVAVGSRMAEMAEIRGEIWGKSATPGCTFLHFFGFQLWVPPGEKRQKSRNLGNLPPGELRPDDYQARLYSYIVIHYYNNSNYAT